MAMFSFFFFNLSHTGSKQCMNPYSCRCDHSPDLIDNDLVTPHMTSTIRSIMLKKKAKKIVICWN